MNDIMDLDKTLKIKVIGVGGAGNNAITRIYCYDCSEDSTRKDNNTRKHQKTIKCTKENES